MDNLAKDYRVIALDCRGHGKTDKPHDPEKYGHEMGLDVVKLLDHLRIKRAHIVGYSMGAMITAQLLTLHPGRFVTATLGGAAGRFEWSEIEEKIYATGADETDRLGFSPTLSHWIAPPGTAMASPEEIKKRSATLLADPTHDRHAVAALIRSFRDQVISPVQVGAVTVPTMGLVGSADPQVASLKKLHQLRPSLKLVIIEGGTHSGNGDVRKRPEFVAAIRDFVARGGRTN